MENLIWNIYSAAAENKKKRQISLFILLNVEWKEWERRVWSEIDIQKVNCRKRKSAENLQQQQQQQIIVQFEMHMKIGIADEWKRL